MIEIYSVKSIIVIYIISSFVIIVLKKFIQNYNNELSNLDWIYFVFIPVVNTIGAIGILYVAIKFAFNRFRKEVYGTWQLLPNIQVRPEPLENCIFLFIAFPIYGTIIFKIEKKVKETDDSHHTK